MEPIHALMCEAIAAERDRAVGEAWKALARSQWRQFAHYAERAATYNRILPTGMQRRGDFTDLKRIAAGRVAR